MPNRAYVRSKIGIPICANSVAITDRNERFFCCTKNCNAQMILCGAGTEGAYFRSKCKKDHISSECIKNAIIFRPDEYDEKLFSFNFAFESMLGLNRSIKTVDRGETGTKYGKVGSHKKNRIHTLPMLYAMCLSKKKTDTYNGVLIDDILADGENYSRYSSGIEGYKIVETSYYFFKDADKSMTLNYPLDNRGKNSWVKIIFEEEKLYYAHKNKLKGSMHIEPIIIAGEWKRSTEAAKHHSECIIHKKTQIYYAEIK